MKKLLYLIGLASIALIAPAKAQTNGTDRFGYTWRTNTDAAGTPYAWQDITATGTQVSGMGDDNVVGPINLGFDFVYYWNTYNQIYIGSNGFIQFGRGDNIASGSYNGVTGMPPIPYADDNKNNFMAPFLADLTFIKTNGDPVPGAGLYYQNVNGKFVVTYKGVAFWNGNVAAGYSAAHTFQVILDPSDSSFTYQYQSSSGSRYSGYTNWLIRGFEDINGRNGAKIPLNPTRPTQIALPGAQTAIKVSYPHNSTYQIVDINAIGVSNDQNQAVIQLQGGTNNLVSALVKNTGTVSVTTPFQVSLSVEDDNGNQFASGVVTLDSLARGQERVISLADPLPATVPAGNYLIQVVTNVTGDSVPSNNNITGKLLIIDTTARPIVFKYDRGTYSGKERFDGGSTGTYFTLPASGLYITGVQVDIGWVDSTGNLNPDSTTDYTIVVYEDNGVNGQPGTLIDSIRIDYSYNALGDSIAPLVLSNAPNAGSVRRYTLGLPNVGSYQLAGQGVFVGAIAKARAKGFFFNGMLIDTIAPYSNRLYEIQGGIWGPSRSRGELDNSLRVLAQYTPAATAAKFAKSTLRAYPNPAHDKLYLEIGASLKASTLSADIMSMDGKIVAHHLLTANAGTIPSMAIGSLAPGMYTLRCVTAQGVLTQRFTKQ